MILRTCLSPQPDKSYILIDKKGNIGLFGKVLLFYFIGTWQVPKGGYMEEMYLYIPW